MRLSRHVKEIEGLFVTPFPRTLLSLNVTPRPRVPIAALYSDNERTHSVAQEPLTIPIDPASDLARILPEAKAPVVLESDGIRYTVEREDVFAGYDPQAALRALRRGRGALRGVDTYSLLADLAEQRGQNPTRRSS